ncbi:MAG: hypothetical protein MUE50_22410, partial [Pirellulaceae bacterium]|nr:hypothetical protein [Pirellulaceae bacterium]
MNSVMCSPLPNVILVLFPVAVEHVDVAAEQKLVGSLFDGDLHAGHRLAGSIQDANRGVNLAVLFDGRPGRCHDLPFTFFCGFGQFPLVDQGGIRNSRRRSDRKLLQIQIAVFLADQRVVQKGHGDLVNARGQFHVKAVVFRFA